MPSTGTILVQFSHIQQNLISNFSSIRQSLTMRPQQDFSRSFCSCCCPLLLSCSFLVWLARSSFTLSIHFFGYLPLLLVPSTRRTALLPEVYFPPSLLHARTTSAFFF